MLHSPYSMPLQSGVKAMPSGLAAAGLGNSRPGLGQLHQSGQVLPRNVLCRQPKQLERKSPGVSAPCLATKQHIPARPQPPPSWTLRIHQGGGGRGGGGGQEPWDPPGTAEPQTIC